MSHCGRILVWLILVISVLAINCEDRNLGQSCTSNEQCTPAYSLCLSSNQRDNGRWPFNKFRQFLQYRCQCVKGRREVFGVCEGAPDAACGHRPGSTLSQGLCILKSSGFSQPCSSSAECSVFNSVCRANRVCTCPPGSNYVGSVPNQYCRPLNPSQSCLDENSIPKLDDKGQVIKCEVRLGPADGPIPDLRCGEDSSCTQAKSDRPLIGFYTGPGICCKYFNPMLRG